MPGDVNCLFTKVLIAFVEREAGPAAVDAICRTAGRSREHLMADHNWVPLDLASHLMRRGHDLTARPGEAEDDWTRRIAEAGMDWRPREERSYLATYTRGVGAPRAVYARFELIYGQMLRFAACRLEKVGRRSARIRFTPGPDRLMPRWICRWILVALARYPTYWGLPPAQVVEH